MSVLLSLLLSLDLCSIIPLLNSCSYFYITPFHLATSLTDISKAFVIQFLTSTCYQNFATSTSLVDCGFGYRAT